MLLWSEVQYCYGTLVSKARLVTASAAPFSWFSGVQMRQSFEQSSTTKSITWPLVIVEPLNVRKLTSWMIHSCWILLIKGLLTTNNHHTKVQLVDFFWQNYRKLPNLAGFRLRFSLFCQPMAGWSSRTFWEGQFSPPNKNTWWLRKNPSEKYVCQLGWWHSQYMGK